MDEDDDFERENIDENLKRKKERVQKLMGLKNKKKISFEF
jgi:hypothetical protein